MSTPQHPQAPVPQLPQIPTVRLVGSQLFWIIVWANLTSAVIGGFIAALVLSS